VAIYGEAGAQRRRCAARRARELTFGDGEGGGQGLGHDGGLVFSVQLIADRPESVKPPAGIDDAACVIKTPTGGPYCRPDRIPQQVGRYLACDGSYASSHE